MNRDEILAAAKESGLYGDIYGLYLDNRNDERVVAFASRIESLVREKCAQVCESFCDGNSMTANELADIIRKSEG
jgi:hypothetical protein